jgi:hypothetical protein
MFYDGEEEQPVSGLGVRAQPVPAAKAVPADSYSDLAVRIQEQSDARRAYFDKLAEQLKAKRYAPSASERLFAISAALAQPTRVPGFGGVLANVTPVFQQFEKDKRAAEEARAADMQKLTMGRMGAADAEIKTALELQQLRDQQAARMAAANKPPASGETERMIARALTLPDGDPEKEMLLAAIRGTPQNIAAAVSRAAGIQGTKPPPKAGKPRYRRGADGTIYVSRD